MNGTRQSSLFVTRIAWLFIFMSAIGTAITTLQGVIVFTGYFEAFPSAARSVPPSLKLILFGTLGWSIGMLITSVALLRRRPWSHRVFSTLIALCIVVLAGTLVLGLLYADSLPSDAQGQYLLLLRIIEASSVAFPLLVCAGLFWVWVRMQRLNIRSEFGA